MNWSLATVDAIKESDLQVSLVVGALCIIPACVVAVVTEAEEVIKVIEELRLVVALTLVYCPLPPARVTIVMLTSRIRLIKEVFVRFPVFFASAGKLSPIIFPPFIVGAIALGPATSLMLRHVLVFVVAIGGGTRPLHVAVITASTGRFKSLLLIVLIALALVRQCLVSFLDHLELLTCALVRVEIRMEFFGKLKVL